RIDKDTSGLLMVAKNDIAHNGLAEQIKDHSFLRRYETVVTGHLRDAQGTVNAPIGRNPNNRLKMAVTATNSKEAVSHYRVLEALEGYDRVEVQLETGRTHQIRVHMAYLGHPVAGDVLYGGKAVKTFEGQCLHAKTLGFVHPRTGETLCFESELPPYFTEFLQTLG
ncbi:MAG: RluA family pseudouridine synthase, partial [Clostridia bacterium]|nr:RluA family pseudouridine synthase [Clostridia bacterium]